MTEPYYQKVQREAAERLEALLALPIMSEFGPGDADDEFDPWRIFDCVYGSYSGDFDTTAIEVLEDFSQEDWQQKRRTLAHEMVREMLCVKKLCEYGTSPRCCWPTRNFAPLVPKLIDKWKAHYEAQWGEEYA